MRWTGPSGASAFARSWAAIAAFTPAPSTDGQNEWWQEQSDWTDSALNFDSTFVVFTKQSDYEFSHVVRKGNITRHVDT